MPSAAPRGWHRQQGDRDLVLGAFFMRQEEIREALTDDFWRDQRTG